MVGKIILVRCGGGDAFPMIMNDNKHDHAFQLCWNDDDARHDGEGCGQNYA